jgi:hypothetical protein
MLHLAMQPPSPSRPGTYQSVSVADAARILGISETTARRMVKSGRLEAEHVERPQGHVCLVRILSPTADKVNSRHDLGAVAPADSPGQPALTARMASVLEPLMVELRLSRERIEVLADERATFRAERDAARAELEALKAAQTPVAAQKTPSPPEVATEPSAPAPVSAPWWRRRLGAVYGCRSTRLRSTRSNGVPPTYSVARRQPVTS